MTDGLRSFAKEQLRAAWPSTLGLVALNVTLGLYQPGPWGTVLILSAGVIAALVVHERRLTTIRARKTAMFPTYIGGRARDGSVLVTLSPGRFTRRRPGESWSEATNRLTDGRDL